MALFSPTGGQFVLYRPGQKPLVASPLPDAQDYQLATVVEHAAMETYALAIQGLNNPQNLVWQTKMKAYQLKLTLAQQSVDFLEALPAQKEQYRFILENSRIHLLRRIFGTIHYLYPVPMSMQNR